MLGLLEALALQAPLLAPTAEGLGVRRLLQALGVQGRAAQAAQAAQAQATALPLQGVQVAQEDCVPPPHWWLGAVAGALGGPLWPN